MPVSYDSTLNVRRYTIGPTVEVAVPFRLTLQADALYKRLDRAERAILTPAFGTNTRLAADSWEFPLLLKYSWKQGRYKPFAATGGTFRHIHSFSGTAENFSPYRLSRYTVKESLTQGGMALGAGIRILTVGPLKVTPEIRYTRWTSKRFLLSQNQIEFLVGLGI